MGQVKVKRLVATFAVASLGLLSTNVAWSKAFRDSRSACVVQINDHCVLDNPNAG